MDPTTQVITTVGSTLAIFGAFAAWLIRYMDRCIEEVKADTRRQFAEAKDSTQRQFAEAREHNQRQFAEVWRQFADAKDDTQRQFAELRADMQRQFAEAREDTRRGFHEVREDYRRLEDKLDAHGEQIADLRQDVGRLQGVVERSFQPDRFTVAAGREAAAAEGVREARTSYAAGRRGQGPRQNKEA